MQLTTVKVRARDHSPGGARPYSYCTAGRAANNLTLLEISPLKKGWLHAEG